MNRRNGSEHLYEGNLLGVPPMLTEDLQSFADSLRRGSTSTDGLTQERHVRISGKPPLGTGKHDGMHVLADGRTGLSPT